MLAGGALAVIVVVPVLMPVITPFTTDAIVGSALDHEIVPDAGRPPFVRADAVTVAVLPDATVRGPVGDNEIEAGVVSGTVGVS